ncbi:MAG TPA: hypothetical protein VF645_01575 [Allosphingosinicella sp.]|jgi:hypothetical protein
MRKVSLLAAIAVISLAGGTAAAGSLAGGTAAAGEKPLKAAKEKKICKGEANSNSRIAKTRVCRTAAEWAEHSDREASENSDKPRGRRSGS